ncbi:hypothetical protein [Polaromonas hydrogenivorans]|uniref:Uncharacterized protein n=1 Tax=Polaromonas hydrogenivorans TaxID=335476 RepID=A0AAU7LYT1_9BURK
MNDRPLPTEDDLLDTDAAGRWLSQALPEKTPAQWALWLRNNRNQSRHASYRINVQRFGKKACYLPVDLERFVDWEKSRQLGTVKLSGRVVEVMRAYGMDEVGGSNYGRKLAYEVQLSFEEGSPDKQFVRLMIKRPLGIFRLEADEAEALAKELLVIAHAIRRHPDPTTPSRADAGDYKTLIDTQDLTVSRLKVPK